MPCNINFVIIVATLSVVTAAKLAEVYHLRGEGDYRFASVRWDYPKGPAAALYGFQIHYCELQAWGSNRCRTKVVERSSGVEEEPTSGQLHSYSIIVTGLKMSTNYSFEVRPLDTRRTRYLADNPSPNTIIVQTKGFSAKARLCLPDISEVEVSTGPFFSGRIGVESIGGMVPGCSLQGDGSSPNSTYTLRIHHDTCGSITNTTAVATFILVQENLPILTHSTRRFLVLCTFHPETLTVRAGLNLPGTSSGSVEAQTSEIDHIPEFMSNDVHAMPLHQDIIPHHPSRDLQSDSEAEIVLTTVAVVVGIIGLAMAVWWFLPRKSLRTGQESILSEDLAESVCESSHSVHDLEDNTSSGCNEMNCSRPTVFTITKNLTTQHSDA